MVQKLVPDPFLEIKIKHISGSIDSVYFIVYEAEGYQNILKLGCIPLAFTLFEAFLKNKKRSGTSLSTVFSAQFLKKSIFVDMFY